MEVAGVAAPVALGGEDARRPLSAGNCALDEVDIGLFAGLQAAEVTTQSGKGRGPRSLGVIVVQVDQRWPSPGSRREKEGVVKLSNDNAVAPKTVEAPRGSVLADRLREVRGI